MLLQRLGWTVVGTSVVVLLVFATIRFIDMAQGPAPRDAFEVRYVRHPWVALIHIIPGLLFLTLAPLQFVARIRQTRLNLHRRLGRVLAACALVSGVSAFVVAFRLPAFGGLATLTATTFYGTIFLVSLVNAVRHIRRGDVAAHREWMIRTYALAMGVASIRLFIGLFEAFLEVSFADAFGAAFWLGLSVNFVAAELWINHTRPGRRRPSPAA